MSTKYKGKCGKPVKTLEELQKLADSRKSVAITYSLKMAAGKFYNCFSVRPASTILRRQCIGVIELLKSDRMFEYIKPPIHPKKVNFLRTTNKPGKKEGIRRILTIIQEYEGDSPDAYALLHVLEGLDPAMANRIRDDKEKWHPDIEKVKAELNKLCEAGK